MSYVPLALAIGCVAGLRSLTAPAAVSWAAHLHWLDLSGTPLDFLGSTVAVAVLSLAALAELAADKLPRTPNRTSTGPLLGRIFLGGVSGAALSLARGAFWFTGAVGGGAGAVIGAYAGFEIRRRLVRALGGNDLPIAVLEDVVTIVLAYVIVSN
jgi:uncharacterized membrane protein